ncbi:MAG: hypothetical protein QOI08_998, partial [Actinomycetota bacterium]|nr:hypothetical protein [Actinomycetota bacterium]
MRPDAIDDNVRFHRPAGRVALAILVVVAIVGAAPAARSTPAGAVVGPRGAAVQPAPASTGPSRLARTLRRRLPEIDLDHVVVRFRALPPDISSRLAHAGARIARSVPGTPWTELATPNGSARQARVELARDPAIAQVAFSYIRHTLTIPNDPQWATTQSSYLAPLRLDRTWDIAKGSDITVAVVDTGVDRTHPDLVGGLVDGHNVVDPNRPPDDDNGHGTMVTGIVAARTNNQRGVVGIAPGAKVMPIKVLDANGSGTDTDIAIGIDWARTHHVNVINLSLGGSFDDPMLAAAVQNAIAANIVVVAAAGNDGAETIGFPASYPGVLAVSATSHTGALTSFSSYGWRIDVAAPGLDITSTAFDGSYATESGTSFSSPIVAGVAALVRAKHPTWTQAQVAAQIRDTARDFGLPGVDPAFGHGIVDPLGAVGGPPAAPHPSARSGADEPNDTPADASVLAVGAAHSGTIAPETDEDWYRVSFASAGWYSVHVAGGPPSFDHQMDPVVELYKPDLSFTASQTLTGGDLAFEISVTGEYFLRVRNLNGSTAPYTISVITTATKPPTFATPIDLDFGFPAGSVGVADVNGDNRKDMLVAFGHSSPLGDTLVVFSQTADRSLALSAALPTDVMAGGGMTTGDLDGDGHADIALPVNNGIDVFTHVGPTSSPVFIPLAGVKQLAIADVDGDSHNDIVAVGTFGARVYWGPGPTYSTFASIPPTSPPPTSVAVGNLTGHSPNGLLDVATSPGVQIYGQTGLRTFDPSGVTYTVPGGADVAVGDVTTDTRDDVVASRPASAVVARLVQNGTGGLVAAADAPVASAPRPVAIADIDNDGANDIVVLHDSAPPGSSASVGWLRQSSPGVFAPEETFPIADFAPGYDAKALAVGDVEGDGRDDLVVATSFGLSLLVQNSGVLPTLAPAWITDAFPQSMATNVVASVHPTIT